MKEPLLEQQKMFVNKQDEMILRQNTAIGKQEEIIENLKNNQKELADNIMDITKAYRENRDLDKQTLLE